ncbi:MAG: DUF4430 domain-containing protein [Clostridia bacterium]|nr:DUF4430 domain-containing protein [Clostridia bacterium]
MKRMIAVAFTVFILALTACSGETGGATIQGRVEIFTEDTSVLSQVITTSKTTAEDVLVEACQSVKIPYTLDNHMFDNFGGIASGKTDGWILYVNGEVAQTGAYQVNLEDDFLLEFKYVNYDMVFGQ